MTTDTPEREIAGAEEGTNGRGRQATLAISNAIVGLFTRRAGRGPTKARTTITPEFAIVTIRDWLTTAEKTLLRQGKTSLVIEARAALTEGMRDEAIAAVEAMTGRSVLAYLTDHDPGPNAAVVVFLFDGPTVLKAA